MQLFGSTSSSLWALSTNLKFALATKVFAPLTINTEPDSVVQLKDKDFELFEPNAIVRYLADDFEDDSLVNAEQTILYRGIKLNKKEKAVAALQEMINCATKWYAKAEVTAHQVIVFASVYAILKDSEDTDSEVYQWFNQFKQLPKVQDAIALALLITKVERTPETNTGVRRVKLDHKVRVLGNNILPKEGERNILITSALPYVNNVPHLGNVVGSVLSADIYSRYAKNRNYNVLFVCGTDEYGTATETKALEEKVTPRQLCDKYNKIHKDVYDWFDINFDYFGRTSTPQQTEIAQDIFNKLHQHGYLEEQTNEQLYCETHNAFLADRFVEGTCPKCGYEDARGDQCDKCGNLLDPFELINPRCKVDDSTPVKKESTHIYLKLNELEPELKEWVAEASERGHWSKNSKTITNSWLKQGLEPRCITRDLVWGTPVPLEGYEKKVLYVWFDACIGYVSITANYFKDKNPNDWEKWWRNPENVELYQFMGKDNVPFHTVVFPSSLIGTRDKWTKLHHLNTTEYLQYEGGKFSKSRGVGVFGNSAKDTGVPASVWRYYLASVRPETSDSHFSWDEFVTKNNSELLANLGNFVNRVVKFAIAKYNGVVPEFNTKNIKGYEEFESDVNAILNNYNDQMEQVNMRRGLEIAMSLSSRGNLFLQDNKLDNSLYSNFPEVSDAVVAVALNLIYLVGAVISPFMPETRDQIDEILNTPSLSITDKFVLPLEPGHCIGKAQYLFKRIDEKKIEEWRAKYGGQKK
ncbi:methionine--tRNA ligase mes1 [Scheffersomyces spartinae]|uniref:methionine--tRNA ligase n=1 Tax=Scheffersomyces spartinae TaxID=45513 RepID=A0A9P7V8L4_9ASCO|nr:methionine--tRNA ligase mes1 [Scheffersomyces spartinae]KAG7193189.1 methionine--tRNA ligase mes1 [Scheffersomyces spartinae]